MVMLMLMAIIGRTVASHAAILLSGPQGYALQTPFNHTADKNAVTEMPII